MPKADLREQRRAQRLARKKRNTLIASIAGGILLVVSIILVIRYLPCKLNADEVDTVFPIKDNAVKTSSGLIYQDMAIGEGSAAQPGDTGSIISSGYLPDGQVFDSNVETGEYFEFELGAGTVIPGWEEGIVGMKVGGARMLFIPPELTVGAIDPFQAIPENSTLTYSITLKEIK